MLLIFELIILIIWLRKKQYRLISLGILSVLYTALCGLRLANATVLQEHHTIFFAVDIVLLTSFVATTVFVTIKRKQGNLPIYLAAAAGVCRIAHVVYLKWWNNNAIQFFENTGNFSKMISNVPGVSVLSLIIIVSNVFFMVILVLCLLVLLCFCRTGDDSLS